MSLSYLPPPRPPRRPGWAMAALLCMLLVGFVIGLALATSPPSPAHDNGLPVPPAAIPGPPIP